MENTSGRGSLLEKGGKTLCAQLATALEANACGPVVEGLGGYYHLSSQGPSGEGGEHLWIFIKTLTTTTKDTPGERMWLQEGGLMSRENKGKGEGGNYKTTSSKKAYIQQERWGDGKRRSSNTD